MLFQVDCGFTLSHFQFHYYQTRQTLAKTHARDAPWLKRRCVRAAQPSSDSKRRLCDDVAPPERVKSGEEKPRRLAITDSSGRLDDKSRRDRVNQTQLRRVMIIIRVIRLGSFNNIL